LQSLVSELRLIGVEWGILVDLSVKGDIMDKLKRTKNNLYLPNLSKAKGNEFHVYICQTCEGHFEAPWEKFRDHCFDKHGLICGEKGIRTMLMRLDGKDFFESRYVWKFGEKIEFIEIRRNKRTGEDARVWKSRG